MNQIAFPFEGMTATPLVLGLYTREFVNGAWFFFSLALVGLCLRNLYYIMEDQRDYPGGWWRHRSSHSTKALLALFAADSIRAGYAWLLLGCQNRGEQCDWIADQFWVFGLAGVMAIAGALCFMRVFIESRLRLPILAGTALLAIGIPLASILWDW